MPIVTFKPVSEMAAEWWRPIPSCPGFEASSEGKVRRIGTVHIHATRPEEPIGYLKVGLWFNGKTNSKWLHRLVCEAFYGAPVPPRIFTAHWNGVVTDCQQSNLRWATKAENEADKIRHGKSNRGDRNGHAKITDEQAATLKDRLFALPRSSDAGRRIKKGAITALSDELGISPHAIRAIAGGRLRRHLHE